jgi:ketosteroid isomerase-like protein
VDLPHSRSRGCRRSASHAWKRSTGHPASYTRREHEVIAAGASADLAYIVAFEHTTASICGSPPLCYTLRATTVCRREAGEWKVVHRHADPVASENAAELRQRLATSQA